MQKSETKKPSTDWWTGDEYKGKKYGPKSMPTSADGKVDGMYVSSVLDAVEKVPGDKNSRHGRSGGQWYYFDYHFSSLLLLADKCL
jgi:hypothetical protein